MLIRMGGLKGTEINSKKNKMTSIKGADLNKNWQNPVEDYRKYSKGNKAGIFTTMGLAGVLFLVEMFGGINHQVEGKNVKTGFNPFNAMSENYKGYHIRYVEKFNGGYEGDIKKVIIDGHGYGPKDGNGMLYEYFNNRYHHLNEKIKEQEK